MHSLWKITVHGKKRTLVHAVHSTWKAFSLYIPVCSLFLLRSHLKYHHLRNAFVDNPIFCYYSLFPYLALYFFSAISYGWLAILNLLVMAILAIYLPIYLSITYLSFIYLDLFLPTSTWAFIAGLFFIVQCLIVSLLFNVQYTEYHLHKVSTT